MLMIEKVNIDYPRLREQILSIDKRCYKRDIQFNEESLNKFLNKHSTIYLITQNAKRRIIIGYMLIYIERRSCYLSSLAILKKYRGSGIGTKLFKKYLLHGKHFSLSLHAVDPRMVHIAEKYGFKKVRTNKQYYGKSNCILMKRVRC